MQPERRFIGVPEEISRESGDRKSLSYSWPWRWKLYISRNHHWTSVGFGALYLRRLFLPLWEPQIQQDKFSSEQVSGIKMIHVFYCARGGSLNTRWGLLNVPSLPVWSNHRFNSPGGGGFTCVQHWSFWYLMCWIKILLSLIIYIAGTAHEICSLFWSVNTVCCDTGGVVQIMSLEFIWHIKHCIAAAVSVADWYA